MRALSTLAVLLAATFLAGCSSSPPFADPGTDAPAAGTTTETDSFSFDVPASAGAAGLGVSNRFPFTVPAGATHMTFEAGWGCVTMCPLILQLAEGEEEVRAEAEGGYDATLEVASPAAGQWYLYVFARDGTTVGTEGAAALTFQVAA